MRVKLRLVMTLARAGVPVDTVTIREPGSAIATYMSWATPEQIVLGGSLIAAFDWSDAAQKAWEDAQQPERSGLRDASYQAIQSIDSYLVLADSASSAQVRVQVKMLSQITRRVIKRLLQLSEAN